MTGVPDDVLRDALRAGSGGADLPAAPINGWDDVRVRARHRRTLRRVRTATAAVVVGAAVVVAIGVYGGDDRESTRVEVVDSTPGDAAPERIVAAVDGRLVVLDASDGSIERVIHDTGAAWGAEGLAVSRDGGSVVVSLFNVHECETDGSANLRWIDTRTGDVRWIAVAGSSLLTPDGRRIVYATCRSLGGGRPRRAVLGVSDADPEGSWGLEMPGGPAGDARWLDPVAFLPSGRLLVRLDDDWSQAYTLDLDRYTEAAPGQPPVYEPLELPAGTTAVAALGDTGGLVVAREIASGTELIEVDADSGAHVRTLFEIRGLSVVALRSDPTGAHLVFTATPRESPGERRSPRSASSLWRWSHGENAPRKIASFGEVADAAWLPDSAPSAPQPLPTGDPIGDGEIAALRGDHRLVTLDVADGRETGEIGWAGSGGEGAEEVTLEPGAVTVEVTPDRRTVLHDGFRRESQACDTGRPIARNLVAKAPGTGHGGTLGLGRWPASSSDGGRIGYLRPSAFEETCAEPLYDLVVRDLEAGAERSWSLRESGGARGTLVGPLSFDTDSRHLLVGVERGEEKEWWIVDTDAPAGEMVGERIPFRDGAVPYGLWMSPEGGLIGVMNDGWVGTFYEDGTPSLGQRCPGWVADCRVDDVLWSPDGDQTLLLVSGYEYRGLVDFWTGEEIVADVVAADW